MISEKLNNLKNYIKSLESVAVAFSGGVDSTLLLYVANDVLHDNAIAITASSAAIPENELNEAENFCAENKIKHIIFNANDLQAESFKNNPENRCYLCKRALFSKMSAITQEHGLKNLIEGSNVDDLQDYRPGLRAIEELKIKSPLKIAGLSKNDIREISKSIGLKTWNKPSCACLASRFVYGENITPEKLKIVDRSESLLLSLGFKQMRVRVHGNIARIEITQEDFTRIIQNDMRLKIYDGLKNFGFDYVTLDLKGYRTGSMNEIIKHN